MTEHNVSEAWIGRSGLTSGSRTYTNEWFSGWEVYDAGQGGVITVYHQGDSVDTQPTLAEAFAVVEGSGQIPIRRRDEDPVTWPQQFARVATVDPNREIPGDELKALIAVQVAESGMQLAIQILGDALAQPVSEVDAKVNRAITLLSVLTGETTTRITTAVKKQAVSDDIAALARLRLSELVERVDNIMEKRS